MVSLKIISCNVRGLNNTFKRHKIFRFLHEQNVDLALIQETHFTDKNTKRYRIEWGGGDKCGLITENQMQEE